MCHSLVIIITIIIITIIIIIIIMIIIDIIIIITIIIIMVLCVRMKRGGSCETTADCVGGNVCSKWGWCQWTTIYGEEGPSQGAAAAAGGKVG